MIWSAISGISSSKRRRTKSGWVRLRMILTRWPTLRTSRMMARMRSLGWWLSPGICSLRGRSASVLPRLTMTAPPSNRCTVPVTRSPRWSSNSSKRLSRSASRIFWMITCLAVWAAIRPSSDGSILIAVLGRLDRARLGVDVDLDLGGLGVVLLGRGGECRLDPLEQNILGDILVAVDAIDDADQIDAHSSPPRRGRTTPESGIVRVTGTSRRPAPRGGVVQVSCRDVPALSNASLEPRRRPPR